MPSGIPQAASAVPSLIGSWRSGFLRLPPQQQLPTQSVVLSRLAQSSAASDVSRASAMFPESEAVRLVLRFGWRIVHDVRPDEAGEHNVLNVFLEVVGAK